MKLVLICLFAFVLCTVHGETTDATSANVESTTELLDDTTNDGATQANNGATQANEGATEANEGATEANEGATQANEGATQANEGATQANEGATQANEGVTEANDGVNDNSTGSTTDSNSVFTCYSCGNYSNNTMAKCKSADNTTDCPEKECWIYLNEKDGTYARGCKSTDYKANNFKCTDYTTETCTTVDSASLCAKCCNDNKDCNTGELAGKKSSAPTSFSGLFLAVAAATVGVSLTK